MQRLRKPGVRPQTARQNHSWLHPVSRPARFRSLEFRPPMMARIQPQPVQFLHRADENRELALVPDTGGPTLTRIRPRGTRSRLGPIPGLLILRQPMPVRLRHSVPPMQPHPGRHPELNPRHRVIEQPGGPRVQIQLQNLRGAGIRKRDELESRPRKRPQHDGPRGRPRGPGGGQHRSTPRVRTRLGRRRKGMPDPVGKFRHGPCFPGGIHLGRPVCPPPAREGRRR